MSTQLAVITGESLIGLLIWLIVGGLILWVINWAVAQFKIPEPFATVIRVVIVLAVAVFIINALLSIAGRSFISW